MENDKVSKLLLLKELLDKGSITAEQFEAEKAKLLGEATQTTTAQPKAESIVEPKDEKKTDSLKKSKKKGGIIVACAIAALAIVAGIIYFVIRPGAGDTDASQIAKKEVKQEKKRNPALDQGIRDAFNEHLSNKAYYSAFLKDTRVIDWILYYYSQEYFDKLLKRGNMRTRVHRYDNSYGSLPGGTNDNIIMAGEPAEMEGENASFVYYNVDRDIVKCGIHIWGAETNDEGEIEIGDWEIEKGNYWGRYTCVAYKGNQSITLTIESNGSYARVYVDGSLIDNNFVIIKRDVDDFSNPLSKYCAINEYEWSEDLSNLFDTGNFEMSIDGFIKHFGNELRGAHNVAARQYEIYFDD